MAPAPRPGSLEWLADQRPDETVLLHPGGALTRARWEARAEALAAHLVDEHAIAPGALLGFAGPVGPDWFALSWAAAKLGAGLAALPPGPVLGLDAAHHVTADDLAASVSREPQRETTHRERLSGTHPPPDAIAFSRLGRPVRRGFSPEGVAAIGTTLADLIARVRAVPGTTLVAVGSAADPLVPFVANVVLVGGGRVVTAADPATALALGAEHDATLAALSPAALDDLARLPPAGREALDTTGLGHVVLGGAPVDRAAVEDLFGPDVLVDAYATADTGVVAVRGPGQDAHELLDGVAARVTPGGLLEVRSPLAAAAGWVPTGDRAALDGAALTLR